MEKNELQLPAKFGQYVDIDTMLEEGDKTWDTQGISDKYSTGLPMLDNYFSGGYGKKNSYEMVLVASAPKCFKTTFAMQMLIEPLKKKVPMLWVLAEMSYGETVNMIRAFFYPDIKKADKYLKDAYDAGSLKVMDKDTIDGFTDIEQVKRGIEVASAEGCELFYIDPLNYLTKQVAKNQDGQNRIEFDFTKWLKRHLEKQNKTALLVMHNTKDPNLHRQSGLAGTADFPRIATKVIETRNEGYLPKTGAGRDATVPGSLLSIELWSARGTEQWRFAPLVLKAVKNPDHKGVKICELDANDYKNIGIKDDDGKTTRLLDPEAPDKRIRKLWWVQESLGSDCSNG